MADEEILLGLIALVAFGFIIFAYMKISGKSNTAKASEPVKQEKKTDMENQHEEALMITLASIVLIIIFNSMNIGGLLLAGAYALLLFGILKFVYKKK